MVCDSALPHHGYKHSAATNFGTTEIVPASLTDLED